MRWEVKSPSCGSIPSSFLSDAAMKAHRLRIRLRKGCGRDVIAKLLDSDRCPSGQNGMLVRGKRKDNAECPSRWGCYRFVPPR